MSDEMLDAYTMGLYDGKKQLLEVLQEIRDETDGLTFYWCEVHPRSVIDECLAIIDKHLEQYKEETE